MSTRPSPMDVQESAHILQCGKDQLVSVLHQAEKPSNRAVLIIVGGPQYRAGGHRYFVKLARRLAQEGYSVMRFDCRGMGDSDGTHPGYEHLEKDISTALEALFRLLPQTKDVGLWGLCDGASASVLYCHKDPRIGRLMLLNPWVRDDEAYDRVLLRHYYAKRLFDKEFWLSLLRGKVNPLHFPRLLLKLARQKLAPAKNGPSHDSPSDQASPMAAKLVEALSAFKGPVQLVLSGNDLTAKEFEQEANRIKIWRALQNASNFQTLALTEADHTFSTPEWSQAVTEKTLEWISAP
ncbi:hydrolase 1, exosortase A system-associated [Iodidimonas gelatinilytica]|uniref:Hydrolase 1, exosortase A system-associated n=1 Tax=Iodidimonas gelatinilytica TaxID=1236966 RepID=A0A5A7MW15_9PROT|nr:hydrolase 1, exosortase A system-associated [Iodidimonas gelatinilytica]GEQ96462.1 hydrolase 1, exosortase A system-associated [Iodidimonas gelatinilytica]GER00213.1 hydrolase 1, exosortase A system-associated [Iodidimonas gelatinilytica]